MASIPFRSGPGSPRPRGVVAPQVGGRARYSKGRSCRESCECDVPGSKGTRLGNPATPDPFSGWSRWPPSCRFRARRRIAHSQKSLDCLVLRIFQLAHLREYRIEPILDRPLGIRPPYFRNLPFRYGHGATREPRCLLSLAILAFGTRFVAQTWSLEHFCRNTEAACVLDRASIRSDGASLDIRRSDLSSFSAKGSDVFWSRGTSTNRFPPAQKKYRLLVTVAASLASLKRSRECVPREGWNYWYAQLSQEVSISPYRVEASWFD